MKFAIAVLLLVVSAALGFVAYQIAEERRGLQRKQDALGAEFGCDAEHPIFGTDSMGQTACYKRDACNTWVRLTCRGLTPEPALLAEWEGLEGQRDSLEDLQIWYTAIAVNLGYAVVGWHLHSLLVSVLGRFMRPKWALLLALAVNATIMNAVGVLRSIIGLLKPSRPSLV